MGTLLYGSGLRVPECTKLRVKDLAFDRHELTVRDAVVREQHEADLAAGSGAVSPPDALDRSQSGLALAVAFSCQPPLRRSCDR